MAGLKTRKIQTEFLFQDPKSDCKLGVVGGGEERTFFSPNLLESKVPNSQRSNSCEPRCGSISAGLRTLCFAVAEITESDYQEWLSVYQRAATSIQNRALKLEESYELIEKVSGPGCLKRSCNEFDRDSC